MCVVSMIGDHYNDQFQPYKKYIPEQVVTWPNGNATTTIIDQQYISKAEFDELKKEVLHMKELLIKAKIYDEKNNEPDCEVESKMATLRAVAKLVGVDLDDILGKAEKYNDLNK